MSTDNIFNKNLKFIFFLIIFAEILSFFGYYFQIINSISFFVILILTLVLSLYRPECGLYIALAELFIGSFGYLFYFEQGGLKISLRLALWLVIMSVWVTKTIVERFKSNKLSIAFFRSKYFYYFLTLFIIIGLGVIRGRLAENSTNNLFFDFNNWLYFLIIFPVYSALSDEKALSAVKQIFLASTAWLSIKTILLFYIFSHNFGALTLNIYRWIRESGVGEITRVQGGFFRIFLQSQIFILIGFFIVLFYLLKLTANRETGDKKNLAYYFLLLSLFLSATLISFSRSFWFGLAAGGSFFWLVIIFKLKISLKQLLAFNAKILAVAVISLALGLGALKIPYPEPYGGFNPADLLNDRLSQVGEAGASSRWQLLPPLWQKIKSSPVLGQGFGATVTYKTEDPRILESHPEGLYTTYAFEWGWLDVWLKLGLFGLLVYLAIFIKLIYDGIKNSSMLSLGLITGLIALMAVNMFSPYVNHPLGIGYLIIVAGIIESLKIKM